jgi:hypothetical protein
MNSLAAWIAMTLMALRSVLSIFHGVAAPETGARARFPQLLRRHLGNMIKVINMITHPVHVSDVSGKQRRKRPETGV